MAQTVREGKRNQTKLDFNEIREEPIQVQEGNRNLNDAICDVCLITTLSSVDVNIALYLCFICNKYLCQDCFEGHESHTFFEKREKERMKKYFRDEIMNESDCEIGEMLGKEDVSMVDRLNVKHELDKDGDYWITGLCGQDDTRWVICDHYNDCIKVFSIGSQILQRYIRFGSGPWGVTEIKVERESTKQGVIAASDISVPNQSKPDKQCMLAVTLPGKLRILFIDLTHNPSVITTSIKTKKHCHSIAFSGDQIVTLCNDDKNGDGPWFICVLSTGGDVSKTINTHLNLYYPYLAVCPGRFYLTDWDNDKVICMNDEGEKISHKTIKGSWPEGISVDPDTNNVYISARGHNTLCGLDSRLKSFESLFQFKSVNTGRPDSLCVYRDRLYVSHDPRWYTPGHIVTVVRVL